MIPTSVRIFVCTERQDMRRSFDRLALVVRESLALDPESGALFVSPLTGGSVDALAQKLSQRQERLSGMEARLQMLKVAPDVLKLEVRRLEAEVRHRIDHVRELLDRDPEEARKVVEALLDGPATFTPIETADGRRYKVEGRIATGALLQALPGPQLERPQGESNPR